MSKLIITADLHGNYNSWLTIKSFLAKEDSLAVAGDLFDTRYGNWSNPSFDPEGIRNDLNQFSNPFYYSYGNCDVPAFFPGYDWEATFTYENKTICLGHGHRRHNCRQKADIIIQGHTHLAMLEKQGNQIFLNPGTITAPRNNLFTFAVMDHQHISLKDLKTGENLISIDISTGLNS